MNTTSPAPVRKWGQERLIAVDCVLAWVLALVFVALPVRADLPPVARLAVAAGLGLPLAVRRLWPRTVFAVVLAVAVVVIVARVVGVSYLAPACALYTVAVQSRPARWLAPAATGAVTAVLLAGLVLIPVPPADRLHEAALGAVTLGGAWTAGRVVAGRREHARHTAEQLARESVTEERLHIARELHDVVAHSMGVIAVKAGVANHLMATRPQEASAALRVIEAESRGALTEMRRLLGVLRTGAAELAPLPGVHALPVLAERAALAGVRVDLDVHGADDLPQGAGLTVYRIAQEAITNVIKHAAPARCRVGISADGRRVRLEVTDNGERSRPGHTEGHGLTGMRERVAMYGGELEAGPLPGGGFRVAACLPYREAP